MTEYVKRDLAHCNGLKTNQQWNDENVRVEVANSTDFIVGKQTNFNGPVTIISAGDIQNEFNQKETVVIRDQIYTEATSRVLQNKAQSLNVGASTKHSHDERNPRGRRFKLFMTNVTDQKLLRIPLIVWATFFAVTTISLIVALALILKSQNVEEVQEDVDHALKEYLGDDHKFFRKRDWGGLNSTAPIRILQPVPYVLISHTAGSFCYEQHTCKEVVRGIQKDHMSRTPAFVDIAYNFLIGGDGNVYEGRGWGIRSAQTGFLDNKNIEVSMIGDFSVYSEPTIVQISALQSLISRGLKDCNLSANYSLIAHNSSYPTLSPGQNIYKVIVTWDHFDPNPKDHIEEHNAQQLTCTQSSIFF